MKPVEHQKTRIDLGPVVDGEIIETDRGSDCDGISDAETDPTICTPFSEAP